MNGEMLRISRNMAFAWRVDNNHARAVAIVDYNCVPKENKPGALY
jgi:hypothetical protein